MDRKRKDFSHEELSELHVREEEELSRLKRQFRIMTNDRNAVLASYGRKASRHYRMLNNLRKEEADLRLNIEVAKGNAGDDHKDLDKLRALIAESKALNEDTVTKQQHLQEIEYQIREVQKNIQALTKQNAQQKRVAEEKTAKDTYELKKLENRLETTVKSFCSVLTENRKLRQEIGSLLKDRKFFNKNWEKLVSRLERGKQILIDIIEKSTMAYDQREEWMEKLNVLKFKSHAVETEHTSYMREVTRKLDLQTNLGRFLEKKCQKRILVDVERKEKLKREETRLKMERSLQEYREILQQIKDFVREDDVAKIAAQYLKREEENFALFTYVNELNAELEALVDGTDELRGKIDEQKEVNRERSLKQKRNIRMLQEDLEECTIEADKAELQLNTQTIELMTIINGVADLFEVLKCDKAPIIQLLGDNTTVNEHNVLLHMSILETQLTEITKQYCYENVEKITFLEPKGKKYGIV